MLCNNIKDLVIYQDDMVLALNKPSGIAVHPGSGTGGNLEHYFEDLKYDLPNKPMLAHRLDKDTSGCLILGRNAAAIKMLGKLFQRNKVKKIYHAIVSGIFVKSEGLIDLPLAPQSDKKYLWWMRVDNEKGKPSLTKYTVLKSNKRYSLLELIPITGRTHQLRVHCAAIGHPILGDKIYGMNSEHPFNLSPLYLHAMSIELPLYDTQDSIFIQASYPRYIEEFIHML